MSSTHQLHARPRVPWFSARRKCQAHALGCGADGSDDGWRNHRRVYHRLDGVTGRWFSHGNPCRRIGHRGGRLRVRQTPRFQPALQLRHRKGWRLGRVRLGADSRHGVLGDWRRVRHAPLATNRRPVRHCYAHRDCRFDRQHCQCAVAGPRPQSWARS